MIAPPDTQIDADRWTWAKLCHKNNAELDESIVIDRLRYQSELLLFVQRDFVCREFGDYDPSRQDLWQDSNRPWDLDHVVASNFVAGKHLSKGIREWVYSIGNLRAWPMEKNRSDQDIYPKNKLRCIDVRVSGAESGDNNLENSFITNDEMEGMEILVTAITAIKPKTDQRWDTTCSSLTVIRDRLCRIYTTWFKELELNRLLQ